MKRINNFLIGAAVVCFIWAVYITFITYIDFNTSQRGSIHFEPASSIIKGSNLNDLATTLSGTVGLLITAAGVLLLLVSVFQTQSELSETRTILTTQLVESTFFNLMKNHKEVIVDPFRGPLGEDVEKVKQSLSSYNSSVVSQRFYGDYATAYHPELLYNSLKYFHNIGKSAIHIASHIEQNVPQEKKEFYHQTFYYNLSDDEKFLVGMICENQLEPNVTFSFNYSDYYNANSSYKNSLVTGYFPPLKVHAHKRITELLLPSYRILPNHTHLLKNTEYYIECNNEKVKLVKVWYRVRDIGKTMSVDKYFTVDSETKDLSKMFLDTNLQNFINSNERVLINLEFVFDYLGKEFTVHAYPTILLVVKRFDEEQLKHRNDALDVAREFGVKEIIQFTLTNADFVNGI